MKFPERRALSLAILNQSESHSRQTGSILGQCAVDQNPLTEKQAAWFSKLIERAGLSTEGGTNA